MSNIYTSKENKEALEKFRCRVADFLSEDLVKDDGFLTRWLIAREFNVDKAAIMLSNYMVWRKEEDIDNILQWEPAADLCKSLPYDISGVDLEGRPILFFPYARWNSWDFTDSGRRDEYIKYTNQMLEKCVEAVKNSSATQFVILADSEGFSFSHMTHLKAIEANLEVLRGFEAHYPEMMKMAIAVNCPRVFSVLYSLIKPLMSAHTRAKLQIHDSNVAKWQESILQYISRDQLPTKYRTDKQNIKLLCEAEAKNASCDEHRDIGG